jgi:putative membrane protein
MIKYLYTYYEQEASFFFIGIILGSIPMIVKKAFPQKKLAIGQMVAFLITLLLLVAISFIQNNEAQHEILTQLNITQGINIFLSGIVAAVTMIIPGISGSFMLLVMGSYETVVSAVSDTNITILAFFGVGCIIGLLVGAKLVKILLRDYKDITYASILGLVVGSVFSLYPGLGGGGLKTLFLIVLLAIGMGISVLFSKQ